MRTCTKCKILMEERASLLKDGTPYKYYYCNKCKDSFLDMKQLHEVAEIYRERKRNIAKLSRWGVSLGVRIPKELVERYKLKEKTEVTLIPEEGSIRIII
jgi:hypothetical protein